MKFDYENPWHRHANLYYCIFCELCEGEVSFGEVPVARQSLKYEGLCVALSELAQGRGWRALPDGWSFLCPKCSLVFECDD